MFGIDIPVFAFSHCRDVVAAVSKAGGLGVLGMAHMGPGRLREELQWIDDHIDGKPYDIDVLMPSTIATLAISSTTSIACYHPNTSHLYEN